MAHSQGGACQRVDIALTASQTVGQCSRILSLRPIGAHETRVVPSGVLRVSPSTPKRGIATSEEDAGHTSHANARSAACTQQSSLALGRSIVFPEKRRSNAIML